MNKEKQTLLFYALGASALILCVLYLPKYFGAKSLAFGMFFSFSIASVCNLVLLSKVCPEKPRLTNYLAESFFFTIPCGLLGIFLRNLLTIRFSAVPAFLIGTAILGATELAVYSVFGLTGLEDGSPFSRSPRKGRKKFMGRRTETRMKTSA